MNVGGIGQLITLLIKTSVYMFVMLMPFYALRKPIIKYMKERKAKKEGHYHSDEPSYVS